MLACASAAYAGRRFFFMTDFCHWAEAVLRWREQSARGAVLALRQAVSHLVAAAPGWAVMPLADLAEMGVEAGDLDAAGWSADQLARMSAEVDSDLHRGLAALARAAVDAASGASRQAVDGARNAVVLLERTGCRAHCGRAHALLGRVLADTDPRGARDAVTRASAIFEACGATRRHDDVSAALAGLS
jgi:hypothetical protein